jgi:hypothetical protein
VVVVVVALVVTMKLVAAVAVALDCWGRDVVVQEVLVTEYVSGTAEVVQVVPRVLVVLAVPLVVVVPTVQAPEAVLELYTRAVNDLFLLHELRTSN